MPEGNAARAALHSSWEENADAWTSAVREQRIPSRRLGTDAAIVAACERLLGTSATKRALDVGCGEGWLTRELSARGATAVGIDGSERLIGIARAGSHGLPEDELRPSSYRAQFDVVSYEQLRSDARRVPGPFDLIVCNFALLDDRVGETLAALGARLERDGRLIVHTVHPWMAVGDRPYENEWRLETFATFEAPFPATMPWYFRTMASWIATVGEAGLRVDSVEEPLPSADAAAALSDVDLRCVS